MKKVIAFGGGTGMSYLLRGIKEYPLDITAVVSVCDDGGSTGKLRSEFNVVALGDLRKVIESLSKDEEEMADLFNYRFSSDGELNNHALGNLILLAEADLKGSVKKGVETISEILNLKGKVLPFTESNIKLVGMMQDESIIRGEHNITKSKKKIDTVFYETEPEVNDEIIDEILLADMIVLSMGSLYTSIVPNLLSKKVRDALAKSKAKIVYCCNLFTQPGETDNYKVSDHIKVLNKYLGKRKVDYVIANDGEIDPAFAKKYATEEQKDPVILDYDEVEELGCRVISDDLVYIKPNKESNKNVLRHNYLTLGFLINALALGKGHLVTKKPR